MSYAVSVIDKPSSYISYRVCWLPAFKLKSQQISYASSQTDIVFSAANKWYVPYYLFVIVRQQRCVRTMVALYVNDDHTQPH